jgi:hypothetical protein
MKLQEETVLTILLAIILGIISRVSYASLFEVPGDYSSITLALEATSANDTVWVHPGLYQDHLIFPSHDVVLISDYFMLGDSSAIDSTIIDASIFADLDTASVITMTAENTQATLVDGFTLSGGHGFRVTPNASWGGGLYLYNSSPTILACRLTGNTCRLGFVLYSNGGSPAISHCQIDGNCGQIETLFLAGNQYADLPAVFEWNDIHHNFACDSASGGYVVENAVHAEYANVIIRFNSFHDYVGGLMLGLFLYACDAQVFGNTFERLSTPDWGFVIHNTSYAHPIQVRDNVFRDCFLGEGFCILLSTQSGGNNPNRSLIERNWFENLTNTLGPTCIGMDHPNAEVRENVFFNNSGIIGAVQLSQSPNQGCAVTFERNHFFYNRAVGGVDYVGSAFESVGFGPPCTFTDNWFEGNEGWAVSLDTTIAPEADMSNNYWGDPSGPFHPTENPGGLGDSVPANVHVTPWLTAPPGMNESMEERLSLRPEEWSLESAYPNPFNAVVNLRLVTSKPQPFEVTAYNTLGQRVAQVWQGVVPKDAPMLIHWNGTGDRQQIVTSGIYYLVVMPRGPGARAPKSVKVVLLR